MIFGKNLERSKNQEKQKRFTNSERCREGRSALRHRGEERDDRFHGNGRRSFFPGASAGQELAIDQTGLFFTAKLERSNKSGRFWTTESISPARCEIVFDGRRII